MPLAAGPTVYVVTRRQSADRGTAHQTVMPKPSVANMANQARKYVL
jgi:hypothetical protein